MPHQIEYLSPLRPDFLPIPVDRCHWRIVVPFRFSVDGKLFETPPDMLTDFASIPRIVWSVLDPYELGVGPVPHDMGYQTGVESKQFWDSVFNACMRKDFIPSWKRETSYQMVRWLGDAAWNGYRDGSKQRREVICTREDMARVREATPQEIAWSKVVYSITGGRG